MMQLIIKDKPVPKERPRVTKGGWTYTPLKTKVYERMIKRLASQKATHTTDQPVRIALVFNFEVPRSWTKEKKTRARLGLVRHKYRPDLDNLVKSVTDALNGVIYYDDSQIVSVSAHKKYAEENSIEITVTELEEEEL